MAEAAAQTWIGRRRGQVTELEQRRRRSTDRAPASQELYGRPGAVSAGARRASNLPAVYVEHNAPQGRVADMRQPRGGPRGLILVHVTHFNDLFWASGAPHAGDRARHSRSGYR